MSFCVSIILASRNLTNLERGTLSILIQHIIILIMIKQLHCLSGNISRARIGCIQPARHAHQKYCVAGVFVTTINMAGSINGRIPVGENDCPASQNNYEVYEL